MPPNSSSFSPANDISGLLDDRAWLQFQMTLVPNRWLKPKRNASDDEAKAWGTANRLLTVRRAGATLLRALAPARRSGRVLAAFYQRKEPGIRWRVACADRDAVRDLLRPVLDGLCAPGRGIGSWCESVYEPEAHMFGGALAMDPVHRLFDAETVGWDRVYSLRQRARLPYTDAALALAQANGLFASALEGHAEEVWDTWCQLATFHGLQLPRVAGSAVRPTLEALAGHCQDASARADLATLAAAQQRAGLALGRLNTQGQMAQGLRSVLASVALFGWNRIGLAPADRRQILCQAIGAWHPYPDVQRLVTRPQVAA